ncbi:uncharacterized protein LOC116143297 isoform X1 [Pistacia vera]|uniref:uncharacterized protein LOC116143297 isoform X1 n=1 Tax=Pistacia vera TaxID=55513 RepID=UPI001263DE1F|nr:uncharacterized protein LOC116143297 isoform X1 [Pistacia vera]
MGSDSMLNAPVRSLSKDLGKKKRANRLAKLKQCKLDVRREQWLSLVENKGCKDDSNLRVGSPPLSMQIASEENKSLDSFESRSRGIESEGLSIDKRNLEPLVKSPTSTLDNNDLRKGLSMSNSITSSDSCSGSVNKEEEDGCLDDWEAVADALNADDNQDSPVLNSTSKLDTNVVSADREQGNKNSGLNLPKLESGGVVIGSCMNPQAWMPNDAFRPQNLPSLSHQFFSARSDWHCGHRAITWAWKNIMSQPSSCPICCEDLDITDSSFLPCSCGFRLCLFCHKRILEADGRCPGCRKQYDLKNRDMGFNGGTSPFKVAYSCSMSTRF